MQGAGSPAEASPCAGMQNITCKQLGAEEVNFGDELFSVDMVRASEIMKEMIRTGISTKIKWKVQTHVKYVNKDLFQLFKKDI